VTGSSTLKLAEVNEASTIIQSAAHEDANIIFGAVLDEGMKDEVKITVIATGFRTDNPQRRERTVPAAAQAIASSRTASVYTPVNRDTAPPAHAQASSAELDTLDAVRENVKGTFEPDDLDVPAFLRKRTEVM